jgi:hypothetical protein
MRRAVLPLAGPGCGLVLLLFCYRAVLFGGEQFAYRDGAYFYYPLYFLVQQEWQAGRWPLWDPWQNGGQPLLGSPMAAVLYPGKLIYALLPYAWGARLYVVGHTALAFCGTLALARSLGVSWVGAGVSGLSYAFGGPVLFQYSNVIFLVGAAWVPWGLLAVDRLVRQRRRSGLAELSSVLAMQVLGGDPQAAYLVVVCGAGYAGLLALREGGRTRLVGRPAALALFGAWVVATLAVAFVRPSVPRGVGSVWVPALFGWVAAAGWLVWRWARRPGDGLGPRLAGLAGAGTLALAVAAAQVGPVVEFAGQSNRGTELSPLTLSKFSVEPYRLVELIWPGVFGKQFPENRYWIDAIPPANNRQVWEPSLYVGGLAVVLLLGARGFREGPAWRAWLAAVGVLSLLASFGRFASPLWWARWVPGVVSVLGPHNPLFTMPRADPYLDDGAGSPFGLCVSLLPGFGLFRYPSKLLTLTAASGAVLAGSGWDELVSGRSRAVARGCGVGLAVSLAALALAVALQGRAVAVLSGVLLVDSLSGPPDAAGAWAETQRAMAHGAVVFAAGLGLAVWGPRRPGRAGALVLIALAGDLGLANSRMIWTAPQSSFDGPPELARRIEAAERAGPSRPQSEGPFRIHRLSLWHPERFRERRSPDRVAELIDWERGTLQIHHALTSGLPYCATSGVMELDEFDRLFRPIRVPVFGEAARTLGVPPGRVIYYYPRRCFDLWGTRYFILPVRSLGWVVEHRGYASFLLDSEVVYPDPVALGRDPALARWAEREDWQLVRNKAAYPRAWLVHNALVIPPVTGPDDRARLRRELVYQNDPIWSDPSRRAYDTRTTAWIESDDPASVRRFAPAGPVEPGESVSVTRYEPQRVELTAKLNRPGIVILADTFYPGWRLTVDGRPAPILRANRLMRGAALPAGEHHLVYDYDPLSFRAGLVVSALGLSALLALAARHGLGLRLGGEARV